MTSAFTVLGSPRYMAPEQLRNSKDVDGRADLWSIGAVLFQLLTRQVRLRRRQQRAREPRRPHEGARAAPRARAARAARSSRQSSTSASPRIATGRFQTAGASSPTRSGRSAPIARASRSSASSRRSEAPSLNIGARRPERGRARRHGRRAALRGPRRPRRDAFAARRRKAMPTSPPAHRVAVAAASVAAAPLLARPRRPPSRRAVRRPPSTTMKVAIAVAGILVVLLAFGVLTLAQDGRSVDGRAAQRGQRRRLRRPPPRSAALRRRRSRASIRRVLRRRSPSRLMRDGLPPNASRVPADEKLKEVLGRIEKGGAPKYHEKNAESGKLFARERIAQLVDAGSLRRGRRAREQPRPRAARRRRRHRHRARSTAARWRSWPTTRP